jgi:hypothetical protein
MKHEDHEPFTPFRRIERSEVLAESDEVQVRELRFASE